jgi:hypothetical protein
MVDTIQPMADVVSINIKAVYLNAWQFSGIFFREEDDREESILC